MSAEAFWSAVAGGVIGGAFGWLAAVVSAYWGPRKLEEWRDQRTELRTHGPRKKLLGTLLTDEGYQWRTLRTLARTTGMDAEECRRLLIEIGARGSTDDGEEKWGLISRNPISEQ